MTIRVCHFDESVIFLAFSIYTISSWNARLVDERRFIAWEHLMMHEYMNNIDTFRYDQAHDGCEHMKCSISRARMCAHGRMKVDVLKQKMGGTEQILFLTALKLVLRLSHIGVEMRTWLQPTANTMAVKELPIGSHDFVDSRTLSIDTKRNQLKRWHYVSREWWASVWALRWEPTRLDCIK